MSGTQKGLTRQQMADRIALEFQDGWIVNLGVGIPTMCSNTDIGDRDITYHSENGVIGYGPIAPQGGLRVGVNHQCGVRRLLADIENGRVFPVGRLPGTAVTYNSGPQKRYTHQAGNNPDLHRSSSTAGKPIRIARYTAEV